MRGLRLFQKIFNARMLLTIWVNIFLLLCFIPELRQVLSPLINVLFHVSCYIFLICLVLWLISFFLDLLRCR